MTQGFDMNPETYVEFELLPEFDGEVIECLFATGRPVDQSGEEIGVETPQFIVKYRPLNVETADQLGFYSMGSRKDYKFSETASMVIGAPGRERTIHGGYICTGPPLNTKSRAARLFDRMRAIGFPTFGSDCRVYIKSQWHLKREEPPELRGLKEKQIILPSALLAMPPAGYFKPAATPTAAAAPAFAAPAGALDDILIDVADGKLDPAEFIPAAYPMAKDDRALVARVTSGKWVDEMIMAGKLWKDEEGRLHKKEAPGEIAPEELPY